MVSILNMILWWAHTLYLQSSNVLTLHKNATHDSWLILYAWWPQTCASLWLLIIIDRSSFGFFFCFTPWTYSSIAIPQGTLIVFLFWRGSKNCEVPSAQDGLAFSTGLSNFFENPHMYRWPGSALVRCCKSANWALSRRLSVKIRCWALFERLLPANSYMCSDSKVYIEGSKSISK